jgi:hypothetical protein
MLNHQDGAKRPVGAAIRVPDQTIQFQSDLQSDGYMVIRNLLSPEQVKTLRSAVRRQLRSAGTFQYGGKFQLYAMHVSEEIAGFLTSDSILDRLKEITQPYGTVLTGECDLMVNTTSTWHTDVVHYLHNEDESIFCDNDFRVYKIAFYLQDQSESSPATLKVRPRSHLKGLMQSMPAKALAVRAGDAIIFDVRIEHAGQAPTSLDRSLRKLFEMTGPRLRFNPQKAFTTTRRIIRRITMKPDRVGVFMTFGSSGAQTLSYAEEGKRRHPGVTGTLHGDVLARLARHDVSPPIIGTPPAVQ